MVRRDRTAPRPPQPEVPRSLREAQPYGVIRLTPMGLPLKVRRDSINRLNPILADSMVLYALYKKHHWLVAGPTSQQLHELFDRHADEQREIIDLVAERVVTLGGVAVGDPRQAAELTSIERPPDGAEDAPAMLHRLARAHEVVIPKVRKAVDATARRRDWTTNDLLIGDVLRRNETQAWFVAAHLVDVWPVVSDTDVRTA